MKKLFSSILVLSILGASCKAVKRTTAPAPPIPPKTAKRIVSAQRLNEARVEVANLIGTNVVEVRYTGWAVRYLSFGGQLQSVTVIATNAAQIQKKQNVTDSWTTIAASNNPAVTLPWLPTTPVLLRVIALPPQAQTWLKDFCGTSYNYGQAIAARANGNILFGGTFFGTADYGSGPLTSAGELDVVLAEYTPGGTCLWSQRYGGPGSESVVKFIPGSNCVFVVGTHQSTFSIGSITLTNRGANDIYAARFDGGMMQPTWAKTWGTTNEDIVRDAVVDGSGNLVMCGQFKTIRVDTTNGVIGCLSFGGDALCSTGNGQDSFVVKINGASGSQMWAKNFNCGAPDFARSLVTEGTNVYVLGQFQGDMNTGCGFFISAGIPNEIYVCKLSLFDGTCYWSRSLGQGSPAGIAARGSVFVAGNQAESFLSSLNAGTGTTAWLHTFAGPSFEFAQAVATDSSGNVITTGAFPSSINIDGVVLNSPATGSIWLSKHASDGALAWAKKIGGYEKVIGSEAARPFSVICDPSNNVILTGDFTGRIAVDSLTATNDSINDSLIIKLTP